MEKDKQGNLIPNDDPSVMDIFEFGRIVFNDKPKDFAHWLGSYTLSSFRYDQPAKRLKTKEGRRWVMNVLGTIHYGIYT